jgi:HSP20 family protein
MFGSLFSSVDSGLFDEFRRWEAEMDQLLGRTAYPTGIRAVPRGTFPPLNVGSTPERVDVYLFAAGVDPKSIEVSIQQNLLTAAGNRTIPVNNEAEYYRRERFDGEFRRVIALPDDVDPDRVEARYRDGVIQVTVQRRAASRPRQIEVT